jgi:protein gp37
MADGSAIEWTEATWNPVTGCDEVSPGCDHCYARTLAHRLQGDEEDSEPVPDGQGASGYL